MDTNTFSVIPFSTFVGLTRGKRLTIVLLSFSVIISLMLISIDPQTQYSVDEIMQSPNDYENTEVFIRGEVMVNSINYDNMTFQLNGSNEFLIIDYSKSQMPDSFSDGITISVKGLLTDSNGVWTISGKEIQTGCPSKYEVA